MRFRFTGIFDLFNQKNEYYLINKKLDTIIRINESMYKVLSNAEQGAELNCNEINLNNMNILIYNRVLEVIN